MGEIGTESGDQGKRDFLKYFLGGGIVAFLGSVLYPVLAYLKPPKQGEVEVKSVVAGTLTEIQNDSAKVVKFGSVPAIIVRDKEGAIHGFIATCTHLDCTVQYRKDMGVMWCACHNGKFDLTGRNISGPPPRPLEELRIVVEGENVLLSKMS